MTGQRVLSLALVVVTALFMMCWIGAKVDSLDVLEIGFAAELMPFGAERGPLFGATVSLITAFLVYPRPEWAIETRPAKRRHRPGQRLTRYSRH